MNKYSRAYKIQQLLKNKPYEYKENPQRTVVPKRKKKLPPLQTHNINSNGPNSDTANNYVKAYDEGNWYIIDQVLQSSFNTTKLGKRAPVPTPTLPEDTHCLETPKDDVFIPQPALVNALIEDNLPFQPQLSISETLPEDTHCLETPKDDVFIPQPALVNTLIEDNLPFQPQLSISETLPEDTHCLETPKDDVFIPQPALVNALIEDNLPFQPQLSISETLPEDTHCLETPKDDVFIPQPALVNTLIEDNLPFQPQLSISETLPEDTHCLNDPYIFQSETISLGALKDCTYLSESKPTATAGLSISQSNNWKDTAIVIEVPPEVPYSVNQQNSVVIEEHNSIKSCRKRRCDRRHFCVYCEELVLNFRRHLINNHKYEPIVSEYLALFEQSPNETKERRKKIMSDLILKGDSQYNHFLVSSESGFDVNKLLPVKRPPAEKEVSLSDYVICTICNGLFLRKHFYQHASICKINDDHIPDLEENEAEELDEDVLHKRKNLFLKQYSLPLNSDIESFSEGMKSIVREVLKSDDIGKISLNDNFLNRLVSDFYSSHQAYKDRTQVTRKLRDGTKLLEKIKQLDSSVNEFRNIFAANKVEVVMEACQALCNLNPNNSNKVIVGMSARLSWLLQEGSKKRIEEIVCSDIYTDEQKMKMKREVKNFQACISRQWKYKISTNTENMRRRYKIVKGIDLPADEDIHKFASMLRNMEIEWYKKLENQINTQNYETLCKIIICHILSLNRRRPFEATNSEIQFYTNRKKDDTSYSGELLESLAVEERVSLNELTSYTVPAKGSENIATILLTKQMETCINLIIKCRKHFGLTDSIYLFARPGLNGPFDGSKVMREMRSLCNDLKDKHSLTATGLRKHVATMGHVKGPHFTAKLSQFMCHTESVHNKNYVAPLSIVHRGVVGNYLAGLEGTSLSVNDKMGTANHKEVEINQNDSLSIEENPLNSATVEQLPVVENCPAVQPKKRKWMEIEKETVLKYFSEEVKKKKNPGTIKCREFLEKHKNSGLFQDRTPAQINVFFDNLNKGKIKLSVCL